MVSFDGAKLPGFDRRHQCPGRHPAAGLRPSPASWWIRSFALPLGDLVGALMMGKFTKVNQFAVSGLARMAPVPSCCWGRVPWRASSPAPA